MRELCAYPVVRHGDRGDGSGSKDATSLLIRTIIDPAKRLADSIALAVEELNKIVSQAHVSLSETT